MATIENLTDPAEWVGVRDKAVFRFHVARLMLSGYINTTYESGAFPGKAAFHFNPYQPVGTLALGDRVTIYDSPYQTNYIGTWEIIGVEQVEDGVFGFFDLYYLNLTKETAYFLGSPLNFAYIQTVIRHTEPLTVRISGADMGSTAPDAYDLEPLTTITVSANPSTGYYTVNVAEYLKALIEALPNDIVTEVAHMYTPYAVEAEYESGWLQVGNVAYYALDSMLTDLAAYHTHGEDQLLLSPSGNTLPYWPGCFTVASWIRANNTAGDQVYSYWFSDVEAAATFNVPVLPASEGTDPEYAPVTFVALPCPKFAPVQLLWRNPQGGWSTWLFGYNNDTFDETEEDEPYVNGSNEAIAQGVVALKRMALYSGFLTREPFLNLLQTLRYSEHVYVVPGTFDPNAIVEGQDPGFERVNVTRGSFFVKKAGDKRWTVDCEITYAKPLAT